MSDDVQHGVGGPKTPEGKAKVRLNAVKHGILSTEAVIRLGDLKEDEDEYATLREQFFSEMQPVGLLEIMLVDKLLTIYWRERRIIKAERASVEAATIGHLQGCKKKRRDEDKKQRIIARLHNKISALEETIHKKDMQLDEQENEGEEIGVNHYSYLSDDEDFMEDQAMEFITDEEYYAFINDDEEEDEATDSDE